MLLGLTTYIQSTTSTQKTDVLVLELKHFERILLRRNPRIVDLMKSGLELRLSARIFSRRVERSLPLLLSLRAMAEQSVEEQRRREAARETDRLRRRRKQADTDDKAIPTDLGRRPPGGGNPLLSTRSAVVKADLVLPTGEQDGGVNGAVGEAEGDGETSLTMLTGSRVEMVTDPLSSEEMLTDLEERIGCFVTSISNAADSSSSPSSSSSYSAGMSSRSQSPCKMERLRRTITPVRSMGSRRR